MGSGDSRVPGRADHPAQGGRYGLEWTWREAGASSVSCGGGVGEALLGHT